MAALLQPPTVIIPKRLIHKASANELALFSSRHSLVFRSTVRIARVESGRPTNGNGAASISCTAVDTEKKAGQPGTVHVYLYRTDDWASIYRPLIIGVPETDVHGIAVALLSV